MILEVRAVPPFYKNGFLVGCERTHEAVVIDPGDEADELLGAVRDRGVDVTHILLTHAHIDHITGVRQVKEALEVPVYLHKEDLPLYERAVQQGELFGFGMRRVRERRARARHVHLSHPLRRRSIPRRR